MAQGGSEYNAESIVNWLQPASDNAKKIAEDAEKVECGLRRVASSSRNEFMSLPPSDSSNLRTRRSNFFDSIDDAKSSGESLKTSCDKLCKKWQTFLNDYKEASKKSEILSSSELDVVLHKLGKLKQYCADCGKEYSVTREKLSKAINDCSHLVDALANEASRKKDQESERKLLGYGTALVTGVGGVGLAVASGGTAVPALIGTKAANMTAGGLLVASAGTAAWTKVTSAKLREISDRLNQARGSMSTKSGELNRLSDLISKLEKETTDLARNIETGKNREQRVKTALDDKDKEIQMLRALVEKMASEKK